MFGTQGYGAKGARYRTIDIASRVEGASPHRLIQILFEELLTALEATAAAMRAGDLSRRNAQQARALSILHALEASLDHKQGGEVAEGLAAIYRHARALVVEGVAGDEPVALDSARAMTGEIADAWRRIG